MDDKRYVIDIRNGKIFMSYEKPIHGYGSPRQYYDYGNKEWVQMAEYASPLKFEIDRDALKKIMEDINDI